jgi:hypothetical protein
MRRSKPKSAFSGGHRVSRNSVLCACFSLLSFHSVAGEEPGLGEQIGSALSGGTAIAKFRYRYEVVDEDGFDDRARASLLRTRVNLATAERAGFSALLEIDNTSAIGVDDYNSTDNGKNEFPVIADPLGTEINQAWLAYSTEGLRATLGRQRILLGQMRFIGSKPWRQNEQTYDGVRLRWDPLPGLTVDASYVGQVNRNFGPDDGTNPADWHGDSAFVRMDYQPGAEHRIAAFAYLLDVDEQTGFAPGKTVNNSSDTLGIEYLGIIAEARLRAALATQTDAGRSELDYRAPYYLVELRVPLGDLEFGATHEVLGAGDGVGFATPLANGNRYQGWADLFLNTPADGLKDTWVSLGWSLGPVTLTGHYHDFRAESSDTDFGREIDLQARWEVTEWFTATARVALFDSSAPDRYPDTHKGWLMLQVRI